MAPLASPSAAYDSVVSESMLSVDWRFRFVGWDGAVASGRIVMEVDFESLRGARRGRSAEALRTAR